MKLEKQENELLQLFFDEKNKVPTKEGNTPLILKAIEVSKLDDFSREKMHYEKLICGLAESLSKFNQTHFAELDSFIVTSKIYLPAVLNAFSVFIKKVENKEDIFFKACVTRFIINNNKALFQLDYIKNRFSLLRLEDPWLYAELVIVYNWTEGVSLISEILASNNNTSYLFALITNWMTQQGKEADLTIAFEQWAKFFSEEDKIILNLFCEQYGFSIIKPNGTDFKKEGAFEVTRSPAFLNFKKADRSLQFESIKS